MRQTRISKCFFFRQLSKSSSVPFFETESIVLRVGLDTRLERGEHQKNPENIGGKKMNNLHPHRSKKHDVEKPESPLRKNCGGETFQQICEPGRGCRIGDLDQVEK